MTAIATSPAVPQLPTYPRLRSDLRVTVDVDGAFIIEDPTRTQFFRIGQSEYRVLSFLDGHTSLKDAVSRAGQGSATTAVAPARLDALAQWLQASNLLVSSRGESTSPPGKPTAPINFNLCYFRVPVTAGGQVLARLTSLLGWLFSWPAAVAVALLGLAAAWQVAAQWTEFTASLQHVLCPDQHLALAACWLVLKLAHELGHGIASKRFGGDVREFGVAVMYFVPVPYSDVTASWRCTRWERIFVAAAGMYVEWILALIAVGVWNMTGSPAVRQICVYVVSLATITTVLFNANPLCRMDGYYLLSDFLGWPNLAAQGQRISQGWLSWLLLGRAAPPADVPTARYLAIGSYGLAARLWRTLSLLTMVLLVLLVYEGLGLLILGSIVLTWQLQARATRANQPPANPTHPLATAWIGARLALMAALIGLAVWLTPWPGGLTAPGAVENVERQILRAPCDSQVTEILVANGDRVAAGQEVARLASDKLVLELAELESAFAQGEIKQRTQRTKKQLVDLQVEAHRQKSLADRIAECRRQLDSLTLRAPLAGRVIARRIADLPGSYLAAGAEICSIVSDEQEFRVLIDERDVGAFSASLGKPLEVLFGGHRAQGILDRLEPTALTAVADTNLGANAGGPLPVVPDANSTWRLKEPRVIGHVRLSGPAAGELLVGQRGYVSVAPLDYSIGQRIITAIRTWFEKLSETARQQTSNAQASAMR